MGIRTRYISIVKSRESRRNDIITQQAVVLLKKGIWLYFFLLIFEGALRKWGIPALSAPLLVVRDPVAIWLLLTAWKHNLFPANGYVYGMITIGILAVYTALTLGHGNLVVSLYGARILLFHFPLIFLIGQIFDREDVVKMGKLFLWISIPMVILIALQFYSPQSSLVNRGVGGDTSGAGFSGALGYFRPSGTFSFTTGNTQFFGVVGIFVMYFWLNPTSINRILLIGSTVAIIAAIPLSISRTLFLQTLVSGIFMAIFISRKPKYLGRVFFAAIGLFFIMLLLTQISFFQKATEALTTRFDDASNSEGDIQNTVYDRILGGLLSAVSTTDQPFFGLGLGMGTNAGAQLLVGRSDKFLISEAEWGRLVGEMGTVMGLGAIFIRVAFVLGLIRDSFKKLLGGDLLPWMLLSVSFVAIAQGQWAQPTALGFATVLGGAMIASLKDKEDTRPVFVPRAKKQKPSYAGQPA